MSAQPEQVPCLLHARERNLIRREFGMHFGHSPRLADGILQRTWRSGPEKNRPKLRPAVRSMLERGLLEVRAFLAETGIVAVRQPATDRQQLNPRQFAHRRQELGWTNLSQPPASEPCAGPEARRATDSAFHITKPAREGRGLTQSTTARHGGG